MGGRWRGPHFDVASLATRLRGQVPVCRGAGRAGDPFRGAFCTACPSAERWTNIFTAGYFPKAPVSLYSLCNAFQKERSICSSYITSSLYRKTKAALPAHVLLNGVQLKLLSLPCSET